MTKLSETARTVLRAADAGRLADAARATIRALIQHGHDDQAATVQLAMSEFLRGSAVVHIETLRHWEDVFEAAGDLLAVDPDIAHCTAYLAGYLTHREIQAYERDVRYLQVSATAMTYDNLSARLDDAYEILAALPTVANPVLEARIKQVAELLSDLTYDTDPEHLLEAGIDPDTRVAAVGVAA
ncbi:hypothetical protein [Limimaricola litoreus]|uniref:Uncharacterized protein n=1 Tax=Limimaricola litoreus TaxID=2955316 RepID=A0A9X2JPJ4_9RHOB|nr:hypothetical protein [Limimaricola litoreus]MCP1168899.1 hypothetical protein [Limimaricola litoreus]